MLLSHTDAPGLHPSPHPRVWRWAAQGCFVLGLFFFFVLVLQTGGLGLVFGVSPGSRVGAVGSPPRSVTERHDLFKRGCEYEVNGA